MKHASKSYVTPSRERSESELRIVVWQSKLSPYNTQSTMNIITFPNSPFILHQPFEPAGDQPTAIAQLVEGLNDGLAFQTLLGVTGSGKTFTMANVIAQLYSEQLYSELRNQ